jgi:SAM-dependent methyltransferase
MIADRTSRVRFLQRLLEHPMTRGMDIDDPSTTDLRNEIVQSKPLLRTIYEEWYSLICDHLPAVNGPVLELGSGAGFLRMRIPDLIASEVFACRNLRVVLDGQSLPFRSQCLRAVVMTNVLHHIPKPAAFLGEACRCLLPGGSILMIEPWVSWWSRIVYTHLHHEPFDTEQEEWSHSFGGPLSGANGALPWIIFERDRARFEQEFPSLHIHQVQPIMPFRYLFSGGVSMRQLVPTFLDPACVTIERALGPWMKHWAMFAFVTVSRSI